MIGALLAGAVICYFISSGGVPSLLVFPSTKMIGQHYLAAVLAQDVEAAESLGVDLDNCPEATRRQAEHDIAILGGAEIRGVEMEIWHSTGSTEEVEGTVITLEYRSEPSDEWQPLTLRVMTFYEFPGRRGACGSHP